MAASQQLPPQLNNPQEQDELHLKPGVKAESTLKAFELCVKRVLATVNHDSIAQALTPLRPCITGTTNEGGSEDNAYHEVVDKFAEQLRQWLGELIRDRFSHLLVTTRYISLTNSFESLVYEANKRRNQDRTKRGLKPYDRLSPQELLEWENPDDWEEDDDEEKEDEGVGLTLEAATRQERRKERERKREERLGGWSNTMKPLVTVRARTLPLLAAERDRLRKEREELQYLFPPLVSEISRLSAQVRRETDDVRKRLRSLEQGEEEVMAIGEIVEGQSKS